MRYPAPRLLGAVVLMTTVLAACSGGGGGTNNAGRTSPSTTTAPTVATTTAEPQPSTSPADACATPKVAVSGPPGQSTFVDKAGFVTALAWAPDGRLFFAEHAGAIKIDAGGSIKTFATVPTVTEERNGSYSERGLLGLALSPNFATDHNVFAFYSRNDFTTQVVVRFTDCAGAASAPTTLITLPSGGDCCHKGGRLAFGPDGKLYVTLGDEHSVTPDTVNSTSSVPQDTTDVRGKILRYEPDGSIPSDNPFGANSPVWAAGLRNPFGIASRPTDPPRARGSSPRTGRRATSAHRPPATTLRSASKRAASTSGLRATATRTSSRAPPRASVVPSPSGAASSRRSCPPAPPGSTTRAPTRTPATSCSAARAACGSSPQALRTRR